MRIIELVHGSGGEETNSLIENMFYKYLGNDLLLQKNDATNLGVVEGNVVMTTDSFVIDPIFFKGGNIGKLSVCGTVNDLSVVGAKPLYLSLGLIIEEGFLISDLEKIIMTIGQEAQKANVKIVCGDTKVVEKGKCDKIFINTTGVGILKANHPLGIKEVKAGDKVIISGTIGDHGFSIMNERNKLSIDSKLKSDCQSLNGMIDEILTSSNQVKVMRDPTRGGVATTLIELINSIGNDMIIYEDCLPISEEVKEFAGLLGLNPLYMANEGKAIIIVSANQCEKVLSALRNTCEGAEATVIGEVLESRSKSLYLETFIGAKTRIFPMKGEQLPRIC